MKNNYLTLLFLFFVCFGFAQTKDSLSVEEQARREKNIQAGNPFKKFGYKPKIATLSKGKYLEFHDLDSIVKIGSFSYHVKKKSITGYTKLNTQNSEATLSPEVISRWMSPDPLSSEFPSWSPYNFVMNNPIRLIDPTGMAPEEVIIKGNKSKDAFKQLRASTSLKLKMNNNGIVSASGKARTNADRTLLQAINSEIVEVNINATNNNFTDSGNWFVGGAFEGSEVNTDGKTITKQTVNTEQTETIDSFYGMEKGVSLLHEVIESFIGGKDSPGTGSPTFEDVQNNTSNGQNYLNAHNQAGTIDPRHVAPTISQDPTSGHLYINKPHPVIPQINTEKLINNLSKEN